MLTAEQREEFDRNGFVHIPGAIAKSAADEMLGTVWDCLSSRYQIHRDARDTWPEPAAQGTRVQQISGAHRFMGTRHLPKSVTFEQVGSTAVCAALDELLGAEQWQRPERWGSLLVTFPESKGPWDVPSSNWHLDFPAFPASLGLPAVRVFTCLAKLSPRMGGTLFVAGSHRLVQSLVAEGERVASHEARKRLIHTHPGVKALCSKGESENRVHRFMDRAAARRRAEVRVVEMTGESGDVILAHPLILHAAALNCSSSPRFALSATVFRSGLAPATLYP